MSFMDIEHIERLVTEVLIDDLTLINGVASIFDLLRVTGRLTRCDVDGFVNFHSVADDEDSTHKIPIII